MSFFNIGAGEFFLIFILALLVFGPQRLPELARKAGKAVHDLRNMVKELDPELLEDFREITRDLDGVRMEMQTLRSDVAEIQRDLSGAARELSHSVDDAARELSGSMDEAAEGVREATRVTPLSTQATAGAVGVATTSATAEAPSATGTAQAGGPAPPARPSATGQSQGLLARQADSEIIGRPLPLGDNGSQSRLEEIVGTKIFPLPRSAPRPPTDSSSDGHIEQAGHRSREALMVSLSSRQPPRPAALRPLAPRPRPRLPVTPRRARRG